MKWIERSIMVAAVALGVGCGGSEAPHKQFADTEAGIRAARELGAQDLPKAALQLKIAEDGMQRAQKLSAEGENDAARAALMEAKLDAELAVLLAKQEKMEATASQAKRRAEGVDQAKSPESPKVSP